MQLRSVLASAVVGFSAALFAGGCGEPTPSPLTMPGGLDLHALSAERQALLRATLAIDDGVLAETDVPLDPSTLTVTANVALNNVSTAGPRTMHLRIYGRFAAESAEVLLGEATHSVEIAPKGASFIDFAASDLFETCLRGPDARCSGVFDANKNGKSNAEDLVGGGADGTAVDPAPADRFLSISETTLQFASGIHLGGFARQVLLLENPSPRPIHIDVIEVVGAPGVTLSTFDTSGTTASTPGRVLAGDALPDVVEPGDKVLLAVSFAPTNAFLTTGTVRVVATDPQLGVTQTAATAVIANSDGELQPPPPSATVPVLSFESVDVTSGTLPVQAFPLAPLYTGLDVSSASVEDRPRLVSTGSLLVVDTLDADGATVPRALAADRGYVVEVPAGYAFAATASSSAVDVDLAVLALNGAVPGDLACARCASLSAGIGTENASFDNDTEAPVQVLVVVGRADVPRPLAIDGGLAADVPAPFELTATLARYPRFCDAGGAIAPISPLHGRAGGGFTVTLCGKHFHKEARVTFSGAVATDVDITTDADGNDIVTLTAPEGSQDPNENPATIVVANPSLESGGDGQAATLPEAFLFDPPAPVLLSIDPAYAPTTGGEAPILIHGGFFSRRFGPPVVRFGDALVDAEFLSASELRATAPARSNTAVAATVGVTVLNRTQPDDENGVYTGEPSQGLEFRYLVPEGPAPVLTDLSPASGSIEGAEEVTLTGTGFRAGMRVTFGPRAAEVLLSPAPTATSAVVRTPQQESAGFVDVTVINPDGQAATIPQAFSVVIRAPTVFSVFPAVATTTGGTLVIVEGSGFRSGVFAELRQGDTVVPAAQTTRLSPTQLLVTAPPVPAPGDWALFVRNSDGQEGGGSTLNFVNAQNPAPVVEFIDPPSGGLDQPRSVMLVGQHLDADARVVFGGTRVDEAPVYAVAQDGKDTLTFTAPVASAPGSVVVQVTNPDGQSDTTRYTYTEVREPAIVGIVDDLLLANAPGQEVQLFGVDLDVEQPIVEIDGFAVLPASVTRSVITVPAGVLSIGPHTVRVTYPTFASSSHTVYAQQPTVFFANASARGGQPYGVQLFGDALFGALVSALRLTPVDRVTPAVDCFVPVGSGTDSTLSCVTAVPLDSGRVFSVDYVYALAGGEHVAPVFFGGAPLVVGAPPSDLRVLTNGLPADVSLLGRVLRVQFRDPTPVPADQLELAILQSNGGSGGAGLMFTSRVPVLVASGLTVPVDDAQAFEVVLPGGVLPSSSYDVELRALDAATYPSPIGATPTQALMVERARIDTVAPNNVAWPNGTALTGRFFPGDALEARPENGAVNPVPLTGSVVSPIAFSVDSTVGLSAGSWRVCFAALTQQCGPSFTLVAAADPADLEPNDSPDIAMPLAVNTLATGTLMSPSDIDMYSVNLGGGGTGFRVLTGDQAGAGCAGDTSVQVFRPDGSFAAFSDTGSTGLCGEVGFTADVSGPWFVLVARGGAATGDIPYGVLVQFAGPPSCGDSFVDGTEQCDDGNTSDGDTCDHNCTFPGCRNGVIDAGEQCDDGNAVDTDGCTSFCAFPACQDGIPQFSEECDDGNFVDGDGCDNNCTATRCGNGVVTSGESCDDGNTSDDDACRTGCVLSSCGDGFTQFSLGESCDLGVANNDASACTTSCHAAACGDGLFQAGFEQCDDGNFTDGDGCSAGCTLEFGDMTCANVPGTISTCGLSPAACGTGVRRFGKVELGATDLLSGIVGAQRLLMGDLNGDGDIDGVMLAPIGLAGILEGDGTTLVNTFNVITGGAPKDGELFDFDGDGDQDVLWADGNAGDPAFFENFGAGGLFGPNTILVGGGSASVAAGDFTGDGLMDVAVGQRSPARVRIMAGDSSGIFTPAGDVPVTQVGRLRALDVDGDGRAELLASSKTGRLLTVGGAGGAFKVLATLVLPQGMQPAALAVTDLDRDGRSDVVIGDGTSARVVFAFGLGGGAFEVRDTLVWGDTTAGPVSDVAVRDVDADRLPEILVTTDHGLTLFAQGATGFAVVAAVGYPQMTGGSVVDVDLDGTPELLGIATDSTVVLAHLNVVKGEECDDGNPFSGDGCSPQCIVEPGFECPAQGFGGCQPRTAGVLVADDVESGARGATSGGGEWTLVPDTGATAQGSGQAGSTAWQTQGGAVLEVLTLPALNTVALPLGTRLEMRFRSAADFDDRDCTAEEDGGFLEVAVNGGAFGPIVPDGGYPARFRPGHAFSNRDAFLGRQPATDVHVDLTPFFGPGVSSLQLRFIASMDPSACAPARRGWRVDDIVVRVPGCGDGTVDGPGPVTTALREAPFLGAGFLDSDVVARDFNGDGRTDVATAVNDGFNGKIAVRFADSSGALTQVRDTVPGVAGDGIVAIAPADIDRDGDVDLFVVNDGSIDNGVRWLRNVGSGFVQAAGVGGLFGARRPAVGDIDGDGRPDIVVPVVGQTQLIPYRIAVNSLFLPSPALSTAGLSGEPISATLADVDGDGDKDIVAMNDDPGIGAPVYFMLNDGSGAFQPPTIIDFNDGSAGAIVSGDVDGNGAVDIVITSSLAEQVVVYLGTGGGAFVRTLVAGGLSGVGIPALGDLDGDGHLDIVVPDAGVGARVFRNDGTGTFAETAPQPVFNARAAAVADVDRDGRLDVAVTTGSPAQVSVLLSTTTVAEQCDGGDSGAASCDAQCRTVR